MKILAIDDERIALGVLVNAIKEADSSAEVIPFQFSEDAIKYAENNSVDAAFMDINMPGINGVELAYTLKSINPNINIVFVTGYDSYAIDAIKLHTSGYLMKPITAEDVKDELNNLLFPINETKPGSYIKTFGNFDVMINDTPLVFSREKCKEILAYLIDRDGNAVSRRQLAAAVFEESNFSRSEQTYLTRLISMLEEDLEKAGLSGFLINNGKNYHIDRNLIQGDCFGYLDGKPEAINKFRGEYMEQYSWAEYSKEKFFR